VATKKTPSRSKELEREVTKKVKQYLELRGWRGVRMQRTVVSGSFQAGEPGEADMLFVRYRANGNVPRTGHDMIWIEFKSPTGHLGPKQIEWIERERKRGAMVEVVDDPEAFRLFYEKTFGISGQMTLK
jgi:hypothetical protein